MESTYLLLDLFDVFPLFSAFLMSPECPPTDRLPAHLPSSQPSAERFGHETGSYVNPELPDEKTSGVRNAEAAYKVYGRISKWFLFVG